ncbi:MAG TPA: DUF5915 domain-containing protein, partial [Anaerolineae bacterium]|nr:DUF5915 domain-containing protein [Anaerolineae bacterium]
LVEIVKDELNVKTLEFAQEESNIVKYRILPDNKLLGPRFGKKFPALRAALQGENGASIANKVAAGENIALNVDGEKVELAPNEILVQTQAAEGLAVASGEGITIAVDTTLTPVLISEGLAREFVRTIQTMRKEAGFNIEDRIITQYETKSNAIREMLKRFGDYVARETLTTDLREGPSGDGFYSSEIKIDGEAAKIGIKRV